MNREGSTPGRNERAARAESLRILVAEDEMMLAMLLEDAITGAGHRARKASSLSKAMALMEAEHFDAAVLDVNLGGEPVFPLAALLRERNVPFLFSSGYGELAVPPEYRDCTILQKPYGLDVFDSALRALVRGSKTERMAR